MTTSSAIKDALATVKYPGYSRDIVSFGFIKDIQVSGADVVVALQFTTQKEDVIQQIRAEVARVVGALPEVGSVRVDVAAPAPAPAHAAPPSQDPWAGQARVPGVRRVIAVASGKGGVGKSTVAVNLACALQQQGLRVGLLDCDIYGPSIPLMMGVEDRPELTGDDKIIPPIRHGVRLMSLGFLLEKDAPVIWRGPMIVKTIQQFLTAVEWSELDVLLVDLPPGTGDAQLTLCQSTPLDGGVIVTTPQEASLGVARKGLNMFLKLNVPLLGMVENMSYYTAPNGDRVEIFGHGGGRAEALRQSMPFLGEVPLFVEIREGGDSGVPVVVGKPESAAAQAFTQIAKALSASWKDA